EPPPKAGTGPERSMRVAYSLLRYFPMKTDEKKSACVVKRRTALPKRIQRENYAGGARGELAEKTGSKMAGRSTEALCHSARAGDCISTRSNGSGAGNCPLRQMSQLRPCGPLCQWCSKTTLNTTSMATAAKTASTGRQRVLGHEGIARCILQHCEAGSKHVGGLRRPLRPRRAFSPPSRGTDAPRP